MSSTNTTIRLALVSVLSIWVFLAFGQEAQAAGPPSAQCNVQPGGVITPAMAEGFRSFWPLYTQIASQEGVDNILIAPVHYREHFARDNPQNGQGIFQLYSLVKSGRDSFPPMNHAPVSDTEFVRQGRLAVQVLESKTRARLSPKPDPTLVKRVYYGYNGRNRLYASQARPGEGPWDGSPYVMNIPGERELTMMTRDGGGGPQRLDPRPGAYPIYEELARQCLAHPLTPAPNESAPSEQPQTSGYNFLDFLNSPQANKGYNMKDFEFHSYPMHFGGELSLLMVSLLAAVGFAYLVHYGKWKRPGGVLVLATLAAASLATALLADKLGAGWEFEMFGKNLSSIIESLMAWISYPKRVSAIKMMGIGMLIAFAIWLSMKLHKSGNSAPSEVAAAFKPLFSGAFKLIQRVLRMHHFWLVVAAITTLVVAATRLNTDAWTYGSTTGTLVGIGLIIYLNRKSVMAIQDASE